MARLPKTVGLFEAKTHLSALVDRVARGESITARLVPAIEGPRRSPAEAAARIRRLRMGIRLGKTTLRELIDEGRA